MQIDDELGRGKYSAEEWQQRQEVMARNNALLFYQEQKSKRLKKIKSKAFHRRLKKNGAPEGPEATALDDPASLQARSSPSAPNPKPQLPVIALTPLLHAIATPSGAILQALLTRDDLHRSAEGAGPIFQRSAVSAKQWHLPACPGCSAWRQLQERVWAQMCCSQPRDS